MPTPTEKPVDTVTVSLSDADFLNVVGKAMEEVLNKEYSGKIVVMDLRARNISRGSIKSSLRRTWDVEAVFIPEDK